MKKNENMVKEMTIMKRKFQKKWKKKLKSAQKMKNEKKKKNFFLSDDLTTYNTRHIFSRIINPFPI